MIHLQHFGYLSPVLILAQSRECGAVRSVPDPQQMAQRVCTIVQ